MLPARFIDGSYDTNECSRASDCQNHAFAEALNCQRPDDFPVRVENLEDFVPVPSVIPVDDVSVVVTARDRRRCEEQGMRRARAVENSLDKRLRMRQAKPAAGRRDQPDEGGDGNRCFATFQGNSSSMRLAW
jgi:hypothetical protein